MAPGTRLDPAKVVFNDEDIFHVNNNESAQNNPWPELIQDESANIQQDFSDSFSQGNFAASHNNNNDASFEKNDLYLQHLESKLSRIEQRNNNPRKMTARDMINSIASVKEEQINLTIAEDNTIGNSEDFSETEIVLTNDLRRRMFPEQCAVNQNELLHLIEHDMLQRITANKPNH